MKYFILLCFFCMTSICYAVNYLTPQGVQHFTVSILPGSSSNSLTISQVSSKAFIFSTGYSSLLTSADPSSGMPYVTLSNPTTISAIRGLADPTNTLICAGCIVDPSDDLVLSTQRGVTSIPIGQSSVNVPVTAVNSNNYIIIHNGMMTLSSTLVPSNQWSLISYTQTNLNIRTIGPVTTNQVTAWTLVEFQPAVLNQAIQQKQPTWNQATVNSTNVPVTLIDTNNSFLSFAGCGTTGNSVPAVASRAVLSSTNIAFLSATGLGNINASCNVAVVEFKPGVLANPALTMSTSIVSTNQISVILGHNFTLANSFTSFGGQSQSAGGFTSTGRLNLVNPNTIQANRSSVSSTTTLMRPYVGEFVTDNIINNLFMEVR